MKKFTVESGLVMPLDRANVDTDFIIPKQFLKSIKRSGFGVNLFDEHRYLDKGEPDMDNSSRPLNPDFVLNQARYKGASILLARDNFGCGSSRLRGSFHSTSIDLPHILRRSRAPAAQRALRQFEAGSSQVVIVVIREYGAREQRSRGGELSCS